MCRGQELQPNSLRKSTLYFFQSRIWRADIRGHPFLVRYLIAFGANFFTQDRADYFFLSQDTLAVVEALPFVLV